MWFSHVLLYISMLFFTTWLFGLAERAKAALITCSKTYKQTKQQLNIVFWNNFLFVTYCCRGAVRFSKQKNCLAFLFTTGISARCCLSQFPFYLHEVRRSVILSELSNKNFNVLFLVRQFMLFQFAIYKYNEVFTYVRDILIGATYNYFSFKLIILNSKYYGIYYGIIFTERGISLYHVKAADFARTTAA